MTEYCSLLFAIELLLENLIYSTHNAFVFLHVFALFVSSNKILMFIIFYCIFKHKKNIKSIQEFLCSYNHWQSSFLNKNKQNKQNCKKDKSKRKTSQSTSTKLLMTNNEVATSFTPTFTYVKYVEHSRLLFHLNVGRRRISNSDCSL